MGNLTISFNHLGGLSTPQLNIVKIAARRWSEIITEDLPEQSYNGNRIKGIAIDLSTTDIDGEGKGLAQAKPTHVREGTELPYKGILTFDKADIQTLEKDNRLLSVSFHEIGHVLGFGTLWLSKGLLKQSAANPQFLGPLAMNEMALLRGALSPKPVPVANNGAAGSHGRHWRESVFGDEVMTSLTRTETNPISRLTLASMQDLGYVVDYSQADEYRLPSFRHLADIGALAGHNHAERCTMCKSSEGEFST